VLFFGVRDAAAILYRDELEALQAAGKLELHLAVSREPVRPLFDAGSGTMRMETGKPCRVDQLIREPEIARHLADLIRDKDEGGQGASVYVCGRATVAKSILEALVEVMGRGASPEEIRESGYRAIYRMIGSGRYMQDVFTTYTGATAEKTRQFDVSELMLKNTTQTGLWQAINGRVYDLTLFAQLHPGGAKLIQSYAGMDATHAYQKVEHHLNSEVDSMLAMFEIGMMRRLDFGMEWTVTVGEKGLQFMPLSALFRSWARFIYLFIEIENAYHVEITIKHELLIKQADGCDLLNSAYKFQFQILAHHRFLNLTLAYLGDELGKLWRRTASACDTGADIQWMERHLSTLRADPATQAAMAWTGELQRINSGLTGEPLERWHEHVLKLQAADVALMEGIKETLSTGLRVFETHERNTLRSGSGALLSTLRALPPMVREYYSRLAHEQASQM
jgi:cytochrome b involved in lipid metabolism